MGRAGRITAAICAMAALAPLQAMGQGEAGMAGYYGLELRSGGAAHVLAVVNGVPVVEKPAGDTGFDGAAIHGLTVPGGNRLVVLIGTAEHGPLSAPAVATEAPASLFAAAILQRDVVRDLGGGVQETQVEDLQEKRFDGPEALAAAIAAGEPGLSLPARLVIEWTAPADHPAPPWTAGAAVEAQAVRPAALARLEALRAMLAAGDFAGFANANALKYKHVAAAYPMRGDARRIAAQDVNELQMILSEPGFALAPIDPESACRLYAGGRLIECVAPDGNSPLRGAAPGGEPVFLDVMFAVLDQRLQVVR